MRVRFLQKSVSLVTVFCFLWTTVFQSFSISLAAAQTIQKPASTSPVEGIRLSIPSELGKVEEVFAGRVAEEGIKPLILIQDAHVNFDAQVSEANLFQFLTTEHQYETIMLEGLTESLDTRALKNFPDKVKSEKLSRKWLKRGILKGAEYFDINLNKLDIEFVGLEKSEFYFRNHKAFLTLRNKKTRAFEAQYGQYRAELKNLQNKIYQSPVKAFSRMRTKFKKGEVSLLDYLKYLSSYVESGDSLPSIRIILDASRQSSERRKVEETLQRVDAKNLFEEIETLEGEVVASFAPTDEEESLFVLSGQFELLEKGLNLELTRFEKDEFEESVSDLSSEILSERFEAFGASIPISPFVEWDAVMEAILGFYNVAEKREVVFQQRIMRNPESIVLVGGYHTGGLTEYFRKKDMPYILISPAIERVDSKREREIYIQQVLEMGAHTFIPEWEFDSTLPLSVKLGRAQAAYDEMGVARPEQNQILRVIFKGDIARAASLGEREAGQPEPMYEEEINEIGETLRQVFSDEPTVQRVLGTLDRLPRSERDEIHDGFKRSLDTLTPKAVPLLETADETRITQALEQFFPEDAAAQVRWLASVKASKPEERERLIADLEEMVRTAEGPETEEPTPLPEAERAALLEPITFLFDEEDARTRWVEAFQTLDPADRERHLDDLKKAALKLKPEEVDPSQPEIERFKSITERLDASLKQQLLLMLESTLPHRRSEFLDRLEELSKGMEVKEKIEPATDAEKERLDGILLSTFPHIQEGQIGRQVLDRMTPSSRHAFLEGVSDLAPAVVEQRTVPTAAEIDELSGILQQHMPEGGLFEITGDFFTEILAGWTPSERPRFFKSLQKLLPTLFTKPPALSPEEKEQITGIIQRYYPKAQAQDIWFDPFSELPFAQRQTAILNFGKVFETLRRPTIAPAGEKKRWLELVQRLAPGMEDLSALMPIVDASSPDDRERSYQVLADVVRMVVGEGAYTPVSTKQITDLEEILQTKAPANLPITAEETRGWRSIMRVADEDGRQNLLKGLPNLLGNLTLAERRSAMLLLMDKTFSDEYDLFDAEGKFLGKLGGGGQAFVMLARQKRKLRRDVALKILITDSARGETHSVTQTADLIVQRGARDEVNALKGMRGEELAEVYDRDFIKDPVPDKKGNEAFIEYVAMEYVKGQTLRAFIDSDSYKKLPWEKKVAFTLHIVQKIASGLSVAAEHGIIHRDIKIDNIIVRLWDLTMKKPRDVNLSTVDLNEITPAEIDLKIIDFGIAISAKKLDDQMRAYKKMYQARLTELEAQLKQQKSTYEIAKKRKDRMTPGQWQDASQKLEAQIADSERDVQVHRAKGQGPQVQGTPQYVPPEGFQEREELLEKEKDDLEKQGYSEEERAALIAKAEFRSDLYSTGVVAYLMLMGEVPYDSEKMQKFKEAKAKKDSSAPRILNEAVFEMVAKAYREERAPLQRPDGKPADLVLNELIASLLAPNRLKRYPSAKDLVQDISNYQQGHALVIQKPLLDVLKEAAADKNKKVAQRLTSTVKMFLTTIATIQKVDPKERHRRGKLPGRTLMPANLWITSTKEGPLLFIDSRLADNAPSRAYLAPEQLRGIRVGEEVSERIEVYNLAALLYEALTGSPPYGDRFPIGIEKLHTEYRDWLLKGERKPTAASKKSDDLSQHPHLSWILERALQYDPRNRYANLEEFKQDLSKFMNRKTGNFGWRFKHQWGDPTLRWMRWLLDWGIFLSWRVGIIAGVGAGMILIYQMRINQMKADFANEDYDAIDGSYGIVGFFDPVEKKIAGFMSDQKLLTDQEINEFKNDLDGRPGMAGRAHYYIGRRLEQEGNLEKALDYFKKFLEQMDQYPDVPRGAVFDAEDRVMRIETELEAKGKSLGVKPEAIDVGLELLIPKRPIGAPVLDVTEGASLGREDIGPVPKFLGGTIATHTESLSVVIPLATLEGVNWNLLESILAMNPRNHIDLVLSADLMDDLPASIQAFSDKNLSLHTREAQRFSDVVRQAQEKYNRVALVGSHGQLFSQELRDFEGLKLVTDKFSDQGKEVSVDKRQDEVNAREYLMGAAFGLLTVDDPTQATHLEKYQGSLNYHPRRRAYYVDYSFAMSEAIKRWMRELNSELAFARAA